MAQSKKAIRIAIKIAAWIAGIFLLLLIVVGFYVNTQKAKILRYVNQELEEQLMGNVNIKDIDISVWRNFPNISIRLKDIRFTDTLYHKPMLSAKVLASAFSPFDLIGSKKEINDIIVLDAVLHIFKDSNGYSNNYVLQPYPDKKVKTEKKNASTLNIEDITIKNLDFSMVDKIANKEFSMMLNSLDASMKNRDSIIELSIKENILMKKGLGFNLEKGAYLENQTVKGEWDIQFNKKSKTLSIDKSDVLINKIPFVFSGYFATGESKHFKLSIHADAVPFPTVQASVTNHVRKKLVNLQIKNPLLADAVIEGSLLPRTKPAVVINWVTKDNVFSIKEVSFTKCSFEGKFDNHINEDSINDDKNTRFTLSTFSGDWDGIFLEGKDIRVTNLTDPFIKFNLHSKCTFESLDNKLSMENIRFIEGVAELNLLYDGPLNDGKSVVQGLQGKLTARNGSIEYVPYNFVFSKCNGDISFFRDSISIENLSCNYKENKFTLTGTGKNVRRKFVGQDDSRETNINLLVTSPFLNIEDFTTLFNGKKKRSKPKAPNNNFAYTANSLDAMLDNSEIRIQIKANEIRHKKLEARDFVAEIRFAPRQWEMERIFFNLAGGSIGLLGRITPGNNNDHQAMFKAKVNAVDVKKLMYAFDNFGQDAITDQYLSGTITMDANINAGIGGHGKVLPSSLIGAINFSIKNGGLKNYPPLANIKTFLLKNRDLSDVRFAELKDKLDIEGPNIYINRMEIASNVIRLFIEGNYGLNKKNTDILIQVLLSNLNDRSFDKDEEPANKGLKVKAKEGGSIYLRAVNDDEGKVKMKPTLTKKIDRPGNPEKEKKKKNFLGL